MRRKLISVDQGAAMLGISPASIRHRLCGTGDLSHIRPGGARRMLLIEDEVEALAEKWIREAEAARPSAAVRRHLRRAS